MTAVDARDAAAHDHAVWVEISRDAYVANLRFYRERVGDEVELAAVVKSNAYGHGLLEIAALAREHGADSFCVHALDEALRLRAAGLGEDVLILGPVPPGRREEAARAGFRVTVSHREAVAGFAAAGERLRRPVRIHLKVETGTHRQGADEGELAAMLAEIAGHPGLVVDGVSTHFANIEDTTSHEMALGQLARFEAHLERILAAGHRVAESPRRHLGRAAGMRRHAACTAAATLFPKTHFELVRLGIGQYGLWPSKETYLSYLLGRGGPAEPGAILQPVLAWKTRIFELKRVPAGAGIGYGCTYRTTRESRIAVLPVGYADGYDRRLSNQAHVLVRGRRCPVRGRVCMNLTMVDVTDVPDVALGDEAVLLGRQGEQRVGAEDLAGWIGTIAYEVVARISPELPRLAV